jgi:oligosaccharide translocation protein RFT1
VSERGADPSAGSLVARIVFQPIEEISRVYFSKTLAECTVEREKPEGHDAFAEHELLNNPRPPLTDSQEKALQAAASTLQTLLLFETHLSLLFLTFLPPYLPTLLSHFLPSKYRATSAPAILQTYAYYLPAMSLNGVLEACTYSLMSPNDLKLASRFLFGLSFLFLCTGTFLVGPPLGLGERGLVWANTLNLALRAAYAWWTIASWFAKRGRRSLVSARRAVPPPSALATFALAAAASRLSWMYIGDQDLTSQIKHVSVGVACVAVCAAECYRSQSAELHALYTFIRRR